MRALTMDEVCNVSGGLEIVVVHGPATSGGSGAGGGGGSGFMGVGFGTTVAEGLGSLATEAAEGALEALINDTSRVVNGSDPEGDRLMNNVMSGVAGWRFGPSGTLGNVRYRTIFGPGGMYTLGDHTFNGLGAWDRVSFSPYSSNSSGFSGEILTFRPGGFGGPDGYH
jgi:hypothetical protein